MMLKEKNRKSNSFNAKVERGALVYEFSIGSKLYEQWKQLTKEYYEEHCVVWLRNKGNFSMKLNK